MRRCYNFSVSCYHCGTLHSYRTESRQLLGPCWIDLQKFRRYRTLCAQLCHSRGFQYKKEVPRQARRRNIRKRLALLLLDNPIELDDETKKSISMFEFGEEAKPGSIAEAAGWGMWNQEKKLVADQLRSITYRIMDKNDCFKALEEIEGFQESEICAYPDAGDNELHGACFGDSGGPVVIDGRLAGIMVHGSLEVICASAFEYPEVFAEISYFRNWIDTKIEEINDLSGPKSEYEKLYYSTAE